MAKRRRLGEVLIEAGVINETQINAALQSQVTWGGKLGSTLVRMGFCQEEDILRCLSTQLRLPSVDFRKVSIAPKALQAVPMRIAERYNVIPVALKEELNKKTVILAMSDPTNLDAISEIEFQAGIRVRPVVATESTIARAIDQYYKHKQPAPEYGTEHVVGLAELDEADEMVILSRGDEKKVASMDGTDSAALLKALIQVLEGKGIVTREDIEEALR